MKGFRSHDERRLRRVRHRLRYGDRHQARGAEPRAGSGAPCFGPTAWQALFDRGCLDLGQAVLVAGAAGGVGHLAVQFAKHAGARVIGTGSARNREFVLGLGADEFIDYTHGEVADAVSGVDVALDTVGGATTTSLLPALREGGTLVTIAYPPEAASARAPPVDQAAHHETKRRAARADERAGRIRGGAGRDRAPVQPCRCAAGARPRASQDTRAERSFSPSGRNRSPVCPVERVSFVLTQNTTHGRKRSTEDASTWNNCSSGSHRQGRPSRR